jgi:hypothetical protein
MRLIVTLIPICASSGKKDGPPQIVHTHVETHSYFSDGTKTHAEKVVQVSNTKKSDTDPGHTSEAGYKKITDCDGGGCHSQVFPISNSHKIGN